MCGENESSLEEMFWRIVNAESAQQRERLLRRIHQEQPTLALELERLLKAHAEAEDSSFIETPSVNLEGPDDPTFGIQGCTIESVTAEGGWWFVCRAVQHYPIKRPVIIKILRPDRAAGLSETAWTAWASDWASLAHPCVAKILDAGRTAAQQPYVIQEFVSGGPITRCCDDQRLTIEERVELAIRICGCAHRVHQASFKRIDFKPASILLEDHGQEVTPRLIDLGVHGLASEVISTDGYTPVFRDGEDRHSEATESIGDQPYGTDASRVGIRGMIETVIELMLGIPASRWLRFEGSDSPRIHQITSPAVVFGELSPEKQRDIVLARCTNRGAFLRTVKSINPTLTRAIARALQSESQSFLLFAEDLANWLRKHDGTGRTLGWSLRVAPHLGRRSFARRWIVSATALAAAGAVATFAYMRLQGVSNPSEHQSENASDVARLEFPPGDNARPKVPENILVAIKAAADALQRRDFARYAQLRRQSIDIEHQDCSYCWGCLDHWNQVLQSQERDLLRSENQTESTASSHPIVESPNGFAFGLARNNKLWIAGNGLEVVDGEGVLLSQLPSWGRSTLPSCDSARHADAAVVQIGHDRLALIHPIAGRWADTIALSGRVICVAIDPLGERIACGFQTAERYMLAIYTFADAQRLMEIPIDSVQALYLTQRILAVVTDSGIAAFDLARLGSSTPHRLAINAQVIASAFDESTNTFALFDWQGGLHVYEKSKTWNQRLHLKNACPQGKTAVALSPDGSLVVAASLSGTISFWDIDSGLELCRIPLVSGTPHKLYLAPNSPQIVLLVQDGSSSYRLLKLPPPAPSTSKSQ